MIGRLGLGVALVGAGLLGAFPTRAEILIERADMIAGPLIVAGRARPSTTVTLSLGAEAVIIQPDARGRFVWIGDNDPPADCIVTASRGLERVSAQISACGAYPPSVPAPVTTIESGSSGVAPPVSRR